MRHKSYPGMANNYTQLYVHLVFARNEQNKPEHSNGEGDWGTEIQRRTELDWNVVDYYANSMSGFSSANQQFDKALRQLAG